MEIKLYKKETKYVDKQTNEEKNATRFYLKCGDSLIPIEVTYFKNAVTGQDSQYSGRKAVLKAFAEELPEKDSNGQI